MSMPSDSTPHLVVPKEDARQGESTGHVRYVLGGSLALAIVAGLGFLLVYAI